MAWLFWIAVIFLAYTFVGYPALLRVVSLLCHRPPRRDKIQPYVSIIIAAHNEARLLGRKITNTLGLDYPKDKCELIVVSDGSTDSTVEIARRFVQRGVKLVELPGRCGKQYAQMAARDVSRGEILVFTDVSVEMDPDSLQAMVNNFSDPSVGCVSSEDVIAAPRRREGGELAYVDFEMWLRRLEAQAGSLVVVSGSLFAVRREVCKRWYPELTSDFFVPLETVRQQLRVVVEPEYRGYYTVVHSEKAELARKVRTVVHGLNVLFFYMKLLNPFQYGFFSVQLFSHKLFRWLVPLAALALLLSNVFLWHAGMFYQLCLVLQISLYLAGLLTIVARPLALFKPLRLAGFFLLGNAATILAWFYFLKGEKFVTWRPTQRG